MKRCDRREEEGEQELERVRAERPWESGEEVSFVGGAQEQRVGCFMSALQGVAWSQRRADGSVQVRKRTDSW